MKVIVVFLLVVLTGCTTMSVKPDELALCGPRPTDEQAWASVQTYIENVGFYDPGSAQVRNIRVEGPMSWYKGLAGGGGYNYGWQIAFEVNAKNVYGGYVGFKTKRILLMPDGKTYFRKELN